MGSIVQEGKKKAGRTLCLYSHLVPGSGSLAFGRAFMVIRFKVISNSHCDFFFDLWIVWTFSLFLAK